VGLPQRRVITVRAIAETVGVGEIYSESSAGPEVRSMDGIIDDDVPPVQTPLLGSFRLLAGLTNDAFGILDDLVGADRAIDRLLGLLVMTEGRLECEKSGEYGQASHYDGKHQAEPSEHEHRERDGNGDTPHG